jgi:hypothetical protein
MCINRLFYALLSSLLILTKDNNCRENSQPDGTGIGLPIDEMSSNMVNLFEGDKTESNFRIEGNDIMGLLIGFSGERGEFLLQIDGVRLKET